MDLIAAVLILALLVAMFMPIAYHFGYERAAWEYERDARTGFCATCETNAALQRKGAKS